MFIRTKKVSKNENSHFWTFSQIGKKGMMDDFFDLLFTSLALFFIIFFVQVILDTDTEAKEEVTLTELETFGNDLQLLHLLDYTLSVDGREQKMKDILLLSVNTNNQELFKQSVKEYFEKNNVEGRVTVYNSEDYLLDKEPLLSFSNVVFGGGRISGVELPNDEKESVMVVLTT